jgi:DNA-binding transcriptional ArsR family regulator
MARGQSARRREDADDERLDRIFHALANPTRRAMLRRLASGPAKVTELAAPFDMSLPSASKNLKVLEAAGLISREVTGRVHTCMLDPETLREADAWMNFYRAFWSGTLESLAAYVEGDAPDGTPPAGKRKRP